MMIGMGIVFGVLLLWLVVLVCGDVVGMYYVFDDFCWVFVVVGVFVLLMLLGYVWLVFNVGDWLWVNIV